MNARFLLVPAALLCATLSLGSAVSAAAEPVQARTARISFADLDLASAAGRATLERRVAAAADNLCRLNGLTDLRTYRASEACFDRTVDQALRKIETATSRSIQFAAITTSAGGR
jgi:UrcA family protein